MFNSKLKMKTTSSSMHLLTLYYYYDMNSRGEDLAKIQVSCPIKISYIDIKLTKNVSLGMIFLNGDFLFIFYIVRTREPQFQTIEWDSTNIFNYLLINHCFLKRLNGGQRNLNSLCKELLPI